ncbi:hypothetical protein C453_17249 [Haloferax elongans ATCC BAA-1513]|uniref:DUF262 domain-containing protein n=2 Tax=Haloferax elongans TaxID=403191 RepID=M0HFB7_HALEO|nr:hypothetical protein C453_17249 [Haloferax elongans ATCC BAA-1513]
MLVYVGSNIMSSKGLNITAIEDTVSSVLSRDKHRFQVPEYQRAYAWQEDQLEAFWNDLMSVNEGEVETHFLGSIVVVKEDKGLDELAVLQIVDGQQRLATISVLLCIIRQRLRKDADKLDTESDPAEGIDRNYLWEEDEDFVEQPNLTMSTFDDEEYTQLLNGRLPANDDSQLVESAEFFHEKIATKGVEEVNEIRKRLVNSMTLVTIECDSEGSAFKLFETLNNRGLELSAVDLMKNYLFKTAHEAPRQKINYELVRRDWEDIIKIIKPELTKHGRFFRHYIMSTEEPDVTDPISSYKLYDRFCEVLDKEIPASNTTVEDYVADMKEKASLYVDIVQADTDLFGQKGNRAINQKLENLNTLGITQERTLLLRLFTEIDNPNRLMRALKILESFVFRWRMTGQQTGTDVDEIHATLCSTIFNDPEPIERLRERLSSIAPDDPEVRLAIRTESFTRNARTRYILTRMENEYYSSGNKRVDPSTIDIEHIAPRKAFSAKKYSTWPAYLNMSPEEFEEYSDKIGNLTILDERVNARAQDNPFDQKKKEYASSDYEMTKVVCEHDEWGASEIDKRTETLANACPNIWNFDI